MRRFITTRRSRRAATAWLILIIGSAACAGDRSQADHPVRVISPGSPANAAGAWPVETTAHSATAATFTAVLDPPVGAPVVGGPAAGDPIEPAADAIAAGASAAAAAQRGAAYRPTDAPPPTPPPNLGTTLRPGSPNPYAVSGVGEFEARCAFSHRAAHDPIVAPGNPAISHVHDFFGNRTTDHLSTLGSLTAQASSCRPAIDSSAYWVPTLVAGGVPVDPVSAQVYYQVRRPQDPAKVRAMPRGLRMIAGEAMASGPQPDYVIQWQCLATRRPSATIPDCGNDRMQLLIEFPDCWNGLSLDSPDHRSHMAYARGKDCPATHPVLVPQLSFRLVYPVSGPGVAVSSDLMAGHEMPGGTTAHGDFIQVWPDAEFERRLATCITTPRVCDVDGNVVH